MKDVGPLTIAVCMKISPDTAQLRADAQSGAPLLDETPCRIGTFDENALEEAVQLKEKHGGKVLVVSLAAEAPPPELILRALAIGADEAYVIEEPSARDADALATARILAAALKKLNGLDLVLCGEGSLDAYNRQVGPRLAEELGIPVLSQVTHVEDRDGKLVAHRALEDRTLVVEASTPILFTVGQEINQPRFPTVLQIMSASAKPSVTWCLVDLGFDETETAAGMSGVRTLEIFAPPDKRQQNRIKGDSVTEIAGELARILYERGLMKVE
jgi:electron transfer flavoprotein beta subunit